MTVLQKPAAAQPKRYHHGNLRDTLIIAAAQLIEENASVDFAMIDAARRAGVSSAAPYRHFKDRDALLEAVCEVAFLALAESSQAREGEPPVEERLVVVRSVLQGLLISQTGLL